jgi:hypothetical protein
MKKLLPRFFCFLSLLIAVVLPARSVALLDMTQRNAEATDGNRYSAMHLLHIAGLDFSETTDVNVAIQTDFILCSSTIESTSFSQAERDSLTAFVNRGGVLVATNVKDNLLFSLFGVSAYSYQTTRYWINWIPDATDRSLRWFDDPNEWTLKLGDTANASVLGTRGYQVSTGSVRASFDDLSAAVVRNTFGLGTTYLFGLSWRDVVLRNQQEKHFDAARSFSNGFEPQTDVFALYLRGIYAKHVPFAVWKHTSSLNSRSTLIITHDVDATSGMAMMNDFANYERLNNIRATYFITTHYVHDSLAKDFYTNFTDTMRMTRDFGMEIASHSVSHVPDFYNSTIVPIGLCGNTQATYRPFWNGQITSGATVCGETEVSKLLLEEELNVSVRAFRAGYLAYNKNLIASLENNNYAFNCTHSANYVLTAFPFQAHRGLSMDSVISPVYEIPNHISDVFSASPISEENYLQKVAIWNDVLSRNSANHAPTCLLIHPNRLWKIDGEQIVIRSMAAGTRIRTVNEYGDYWKAREQCQFSRQLSGDSLLIITIDNASLPLNDQLSFIVDDGQLIDRVLVQAPDGTELNLLQQAWLDDDLILYASAFNESYSAFTFELGNAAELGLPYPNPFAGMAQLELELNEVSTILVQVYDLSGRLVKLEPEKTLNVGHYDLEIHAEDLAPGAYIYVITINDERKTGRFVVTGAK